MPTAVGFDDLTAGWQLSATLLRRTPLEWLRRDGEFHPGPEPPSEQLPPAHACWVPVPKTWQELGIDIDELPPSTRASEVGYVPEDGGQFLNFLIEYRTIIESAAEALRALGRRYPEYENLLSAPPRRARRRG